MTNERYGNQCINCGFMTHSRLRPRTTCTVCGSIDLHTWLETPAPAQVVPSVVTRLLRLAR